jgi:hypothetical protein
VAILDVVVALTILGLSGVGLITLLGQTEHSVRQIRDTERAVRRASDEMGRFVVYDRTQLIAMVGHSAIDSWVVEISQPAADLFDVAIAPSDTEPVILRTTLYRRDTSHVTP